MATKQPKQTKQTKQAAPVAPVAATPVAATPVAVAAPVQTVALVAGKVYRTKAPHNVAWWQAITQACSAGPAPMAQVVQAGVPAHFVGYCARRGYLQVA